MPSRTQAMRLACRQMERTLLEAAKQNPDDFVAQQSLGEFYLQQNRLPEGIPLSEKGPATQSAGLQHRATICRSLI